jgi:hypothetical protein
VSFTESMEYVSRAFEVEMDGVWPWRRRAVGVAGAGGATADARKAERSSI